MAAMRVVKEHDERKQEIIDTAEMLFTEKGYDQCSVNDILNAIGIAKGTFYHYFKSKEEVLDAVIARTTDQIMERVLSVAGEKNLTPEEKLLQVFLAMKADQKTEQALLEEMHKTENALMHQKMREKLLTGVNPLIASLIREGIEQGICQT